MNDSPADAARQLLLQAFYGALSTQSKKFPGYPFGSVVPYVLSQDGLPIILISRIAQHTLNLQADARCALLVGEHHAVDIQAAGRLTLLADARPLEAADLIEHAALRYYRHYPEALDYHRIHDFDFWQLQPIQWRFIGGFGRIHWLEYAERANPFDADTETAMLSHMNQDHGEAIGTYARSLGLPDTDEAPQMVGIDAEGFNLRQGPHLARMTFPAPCETQAAVRANLIEMARNICV